MSARLYRMCKRKGITPSRVAEVGVYFPETSNVLEFIRDGVPAMLVEADPVCIEKIREYFSSYPNVSIQPYAVWDHNGHVALYRANSSTFVGELKGTPAQVNDAYVPDEGDRFEAEARRFSEIDCGDIDVLSIDIEGAEWFVLKHLRSRPRIITLETHAAQYNNPYISQIAQWMRDNGYRRWFIDNTDSVYVRHDAAEFTLPERFRATVGSIFRLARHRLKAVKRKIRDRLVDSR
jgi:FkbM family methyltransferase